MRFSKGQIIERACGGQSGEFTFQHVMFVRMCALLDGAAALVTSNGRRLVALEVTFGEGDVDGFIPATALKVAREHDAHLRLNTNEVLVLGDGDELIATFPRPTGKFPNIDALKRANVSEAPTTCVTLSMHFLSEMAGALGAEMLTLEISQTSGEPVRITARDIDAQIVGFLMPIDLKPGE